MNPNAVRRLVAAVGVLASLGWAGSVAAQDLPAGVKRARISFAEHLFVDNEIMLRGTHAEARVTFTRPASWRILPGSKLHILFSHSGTLLPDHSSLTVRIAEASRSVRLDAADGEIKELVIPIDPSHLGPYNGINFIGGMHYTLECEDPFHPNLWTAISSNSYIEFLYVEEEAFTDLAVFPFPYFDPLAYPPVDLTYVVPRNPSSDTLTALARVSASIAQDAAYRPLSVQFVDELPSRPRGNYILVGTGAEQPDAARLLAAADLGVAGGEAGSLASVRLPEDTRYAALIVTGGSGGAVLRAASSLVDRSSRAAFVGNSAIVDRYDDPEVADLRDWQGFVPDRANFTLQDLGFEGQTVRGVFSAPVRVDVKVQPDARPVEYRQKLNIHYAYSALLKPEISTLEVVLNGISLHSVALNRPEGSESEWLSLDVPWDIYGPFNRLELVFHLYPDTYRECERVSDRQLWGTIFPDSNFVMPRDYWTDYPDLTTFARWGFPFTLRPDLSETVFVVPGPQESGATRTMVRLMTFLMKQHVRDTVRVRVVHAGELSEEMRANAHLVLLAPHVNSVASPLLPSAALRYAPDGRVAVRAGREADMATLVYRDGAIFEAMVSPWNRQRAVLLVHESEDGLLGQLYGPNAAEFLGQIRGAAAVVATDSHVNFVPAHQVSTLGEIPISRKLRYLLAEYWGVFLLIGLLAIALLFAALRLVLRRHRARLDAEED